MAAIRKCDLGMTSTDDRTPKACNAVAFRVAVIACRIRRRPPSHMYYRRRCAAKIQLVGRYFSVLLDM